MLRKGEVVFAGAIEELLLNQKPQLIVSTENPDDLQRIVEIAAAAGHHSTVRSGLAHIEGPHEYGAVLNKQAFDAGIVLSQLTPTLPNLEETFFEMTGAK